MMGHIKLINVQQAKIYIPTKMQRKNYTKPMLPFGLTKCVG
jgi:hypothetical protein